MFGKFKGNGVDNIRHSSSAQQVQRSHVKGTIHANRVKLNSTAIVEGDIYHRSLAIEENAQFVGMSRRRENAIDTPSQLQTNPPQPQAQAVSDIG